MDAFMKPLFLKLHHSTIKKLLKMKKEADQDGQYRVAKRIHAALLNHEGNTSGKIAHILKSPRSCVFEWISNYVKYGEESFLEGYRSGRPGQLSKKQKQILSDIVESGPVAYGYLSGVWTAVMIREIINNEFNVAYDARHVRRILDELDFSLQRPKRVLANADPIKQNRWIRYTYPLIKKKPIR
jgi:transposase